MIKIDEEFRDLIPPLTDEEYHTLEQSLINEGCREPIILWDDTIIDGHNRYSICLKHNIPFKISQMNFDSRENAMTWMIDTQLGRRNLPVIDRILLAQKKTAFLETQARENQRLGGKYKSSDNVDKSSVNIRKETAAIADVSEGTVAKVIKIQKEHPELLDDIRCGELSINRAYQYVVPYRTYAGRETEWYTPKRYIEMVRQVMGSIDTDPASHEVPQQWIKAERYYTAETDGLKQDWYGNIWLNPPYITSLLNRFAEKLNCELSNNHIQQAIVLVNNSTETQWFRKYTENCSAICFTYRRIGFFIESNEETKSRSPLQGQSFAYYGDHVAAFAEVFSTIGQIFIPYKK